MNDDLTELADFVAAQLASDTNRVLSIYEAGRTGKINLPGVDQAKILELQWESVQAANALETLLRDTIRPYLGADGELGENAERQLRLLGRRHAVDKGYREEWRPDRSPDDSPAPDAPPGAY
jgi:hypothetical protein